jgi:ESS family glutamate:Na+ symporter
MESIEVPSFVSFTLAIVLLFVGKIALNRSALLRQYSIPEAVVGGFVAAIVVGALYWLCDFKVTFALAPQSYLLLYFFAGIGLKSDFRDLVTGGRPLAVMIALVATFIVMQNLLGMGVAAALGMDPKTGLMAGSVSLTGGLGTTIAWGPTFIDDLGIANAVEIGVACSTLGLIAACVVGGPSATFLINRHDITTSHDDNLDVGQPNDEPHKPVDSYGVLWAWLWLNVALILGFFLNEAITAAGVNMPLFVSCLVVGILLGNLGRYVFPKITWDGEQQGLALISDISLGMFLVMSLMSMQLWELRGAVLFLAVVMALQVLMAALFSVFVVYNLLGRNYEAAMIAAGFSGLTLGTTATAIVSMTAVAKQYGAAHRAFLLVPIVGGFFIGVINAVVINVLAHL